MRNFISEDDIEQSILSKLAAEPFKYDIIKCDADPTHREDLNDGTGRSSKKQCVLPEILRESVYRLNPDVAKEYLDDFVNELVNDFTGTDIVATNYKLYNYIRNGKHKEIIKNGKPDFVILKLMDFNDPTKNTFTAVSQMWIQGRVYSRRPDVLIFVNGLPVVFIELKNSIVKVQEAYNDNLQNYKKDIPNLFAFNQICVLSNGLETRIGAFNASYDYFYEWLKVESEKEKVDRKKLKNSDNAKNSSIRYFVDGLLNKERLLDYIENFILFENQSVKILAQNHQYFGVNNLIEATKNRKKLKGKLGVFWHTQGSGKSYSMVMFARKVKQKLTGNFTFLIITDRDNLDTQIYKNFVRTETIGAKDQCQPKSGAQLREFLGKNNPFVFTLIQKFQYDKGKKYPVLSERDDIIVLVDEAHRTQYADLAENMRTALPNANFVAFTGTPLLGSKRLTNKWFGNYVSEYNFAQAVENGSTVPLYYSRRVPEVGLTNNFLDDDVVDIIEEENLTDAETKVLENSTSRILEVIKRDDRLDKIAKDIAHHFPRRGFLGKAMVVSVDKYTAVKMYDKVQHYWEEEKKQLTKDRNNAQTKEERDRITGILDYMNKVEMAVVISEEADEVEKFKKQGLDITKHRLKMQEITPEGKDIEDRFADPKDPLQLVFVCAMWLTGTDVKNLSTLYLDKPMKSHTLMQAIARANRVYPGKTCGVIVDYVNVFQYMQKALSDYAVDDTGSVMPAKDIDKLISNIDESIASADEFLKELNIDIDKIIGEGSVLDKLDDLRAAFDIIVSNDESKEKFKVIINTMMNLYDAAKPEIFEKGWENKKYAPLAYLHGLCYNTIDDEKLAKAKLRMAQILDNSVTAEKASDGQYKYAIHGTKLIDLSKIDTSALKKEIKSATYKAVEIDDLKQHIEDTLQSMINRNCTRQSFADRFKNIIDRYNAGGTENEEYYNQLVEFIEELKKEQSRYVTEGLTEEELEIYDLLIAGKNLTKSEEQKVKLAAKNLYQKLQANKKELFVIDWYKDEQTAEKVKSEVSDILNEDLPEAYDKPSFASKINLLFNHFMDMSVQGYGWMVA